jgi:DtxR family Mn-dependent transcriptional regulator
MGWLFLVLGFALAILLLFILVPFVSNWNRLRRRVLREDALKNICSARHDGRSLDLTELADRLKLSQTAVRDLVDELDSAGLVRVQAGVLVPTEAGENIGLHVLRGHRLWERYLTDEARIPIDRVHDRAERAEHRFRAADLESLADHLGHPRADPHGDLIPPAAGEIGRRGRTPLTAWPLDVLAVIDHIEDEPPQALRDTLRAGLRPGTAIRVIARAADSVVCETSAGPCTLAPSTAALIDVRPAAVGEEIGKRPPTLAELPLGESAEVATLADTCTGLGRRRLLDLGFTAGAPVEAVLANIDDAAHAYRIRDTMIALRKEQAEQVLIRPRSNRPSAGTERGG